MSIIDTDQNAIEMTNISKTYTSGLIEVKALKEIDLNIAKGERLVILGPSGSGKTTFLNLLGGITTPDNGRDDIKLSVFGKDISFYNLSQLADYRRDRIGFIFQFFNLFPALTAIENVIIGIQLLKKTTKKDLNVAEIAKKYLEMVGLGDRIYHYPSQLSGGQQQRVAIARALAKIPFIGKDFVLLCDEPTGNLDTDTGNLIMDLIKKLNEDYGITCILVTHNNYLAELFAKKIIRLKNGIIESV